MSEHECPHCEMGVIEMRMSAGPEPEVNAGPEFDVASRNCSCEISADEWEAIDREAHQFYLDGWYEPWEDE